MSSSTTPQQESKSSSEILNELFSTFNSSFKESTSSPSKKQKKKKKKRSKSADSEGGDANDSSSSVESRIKKARKLEKLALKKDKVKSKKKKQEGDGGVVGSKSGKKSKRKLGSSSSHSSSLLSTPEKKKRKSKSSSSSNPFSSSSGYSEDKQIIGDGFVILNKSGSKKKEKQKDLEEGEILDVESNEKKVKKKKHKGSSLSEISATATTSSSSKKLKLSASQAYKLDAEEKLLLGYGVVGNSSSSNGKYEDEYRQSYSDSRYDHLDRDYHRSKSSQSHYREKDERGRDRGERDRGSSRDDYHHERKRSRSRSPSGSSSRPRLAPPREAYRSSYLKFQKSHESSYDYHDDRSRSSQSAKYDSSSYYDYHSQRGRSSYSDSKGGFGYVGKSYYYDDVEEERDKDRDRDYRGDRGRGDSRDGRDRERSYGSGAWRHRHRSRSPLRRSYYHPEDIIDKSELLEIARKNAKKLMQSGVLPSDIFSRDQILALKAGGKSVEELTNYCKRLAKRDALGDARGSGSDDDEGGRNFIHHPFQVKDKPLPTITLNIRNSVPLPVRTPQELAIESAKLRTQFPVSSGTQHRFKELEWKPVSEDKDNEKEGESSSNAIVPLGTSSTSSATGPNVCSVAPMMKEVSETDSATAEDGSSSETKTDSLNNEKTQEKNDGELKAIEAAPGPSKKDDTGISVDGPDLPLVDISSVIGLRLKAMRLLQENPTCGDAQRQLDEATQMMKHWADAKALEPKFLTPAELSSGPQAWAKKDQLRKTRALDSGMGMHLLQKMGWRPGEGLGKNKEGQLEPLALDVKTDKKGLSAAVEDLMYGGKGGFGSGGPSMPQVYDLSGKHPVSALMELTAKRRWGNPEFELCFEHGPPHKRQFVYKVIVNGVEYQPCIAVGNKKQAKANAAAFCLQSLGLLPTNAPPPNSGELLQTVEPSASSVQEPEGHNSALKQTFHNPSSFLQTVHTDNELMPPPPPPVPPPPMPPSLMSMNAKP